MKLYRTTRYGYFGAKMWQRYSTSQRCYGTTASEVNMYGRRGKVTLEMVEIDEPEFKLIKEAGKVAE